MIHRFVERGTFVPKGHAVYDLQYLKMILLGSAQEKFGKTEGIPQKN